MSARYIIDEKGERREVILSVEECERLRRTEEEANRMERHPGIVFRGPRDRRRAWVTGTGFDVWEVIGGYREMGRERVLRESSLSEDHLNTALAYYESHRGEIDGMVEENDRPLEHWRRRYPDLNIEVSER
ncbi:MAG: hypothetical protein ACRDSJ_00800 [Rubrobacteraceae bacterium]